METIDASAVRDHYDAPDLLERIRDALRGAGLDPEAPTREDVARLEEFHIGGREATRELAELAGFGPGDHVLDLGAGLGGPARTLAVEYGCRVTALELTPSFCRVARWLTDALGCADRMEVRQGDALRPPFPDASFDGVVIEHVGMNIPDKAALFAQCRRLLRDGGRVALYEICAGDGGEVIFPVPWAEGPATSHLATPEDLLRTAREAGLRPVRWEDVTDVAAQRFAAMMAEPEEDVAGAAPGLGLVIGESLPLKGANLGRSFAESRVRVVRGVLAA